MLNEIRAKLHTLLSDVDGLKSVEDFADQLEDDKGFVKRTPAILIPAMSAQFKQVSTAQVYTISAYASLFLFCYNRQGHDKLIEKAETIVQNVLTALVQDYKVELQEIVAVEAKSPLLVYEIRLLYKPERFGV